MSFSPYSYAATQRHGYSAPAEGDFDVPSYLAGSTPGSSGDYGFLPLAAIPVWLWVTGGIAAATAATGGAYVYGQSKGEEQAAAAAAQAQAQAAPPPQGAPGYAPLPQGQLPPGYAVPGGPGTYPTGYPGGAGNITQQPWFWPVLVGGVLVLGYLYTQQRDA